MVLTGILSRQELEQLHTENRALLGYYAESSGNTLSTFRDNLSVRFLSVKFPKERQKFNR